MRPCRFNEAGNHQRHTRTINVSPQTQANNAARVTNGNPPTRALYMHPTRTPASWPYQSKAGRQSKAGELCLCPADRRMPIGHISLNHTNNRYKDGCRHALQHNHHCTKPTQHQPWLRSPMRTDIEQVRVSREVVQKPAAYLLKGAHCAWQPHMPADSVATDCSEDVPS